MNSSITGNFVLVKEESATENKAGQKRKGRN